MNCQILLLILTSLTMMPSNSPGLAMAVPCRNVDMDNRKSKSNMDNMDRKETMSNRKKEEFPCIDNVPVVVKCENGGTRNLLGQCVCPRPFYGDRCQKRSDISFHKPCPIKQFVPSLVGWSVRYSPPSCIQCNTVMLAFFSINPKTENRRS